MKGNKMSAILAILLMLSGLVAIIPLAHAITPVGAWTDSLTTPPPATPNVTYQWGVGPGQPFYTFTVGIWVYNIAANDGVTTWSVGFYFNPHILQVLSVTNGSILDIYGGLASGNYAYVPGSIDNVHGLVNSYTWSLYSTDTVYPFTAPNQWVSLMFVNFEVNTTLTTGEITPLFGKPQNMTAFSTVSGDPTQIVLLDANGNDITPYGSITNGTITYTKVTLPASAPTITTNVTPGYTETVGTAQTFTATITKPGFNGTQAVSPSEYVWTFPNLTIFKGPTLSSITNTFTPAGTYTVTCQVWEWIVDNATYTYNMSSNLEAQTVTLIPKASGCAIALYTQSWRYVDPFYINTQYVGDLIPAIQNYSEADSFRPGDLVELFANTTYNGAPVQGALVTFQVYDNKGNTVLVSTAISNCYGLSQWEFRIPWPSNASLQVNNFTEGSMGPSDNSTLFGDWHATATWQLGSQFTEMPPFEKTQAAEISWDVSWGLSIVGLSVTPTTAHRGPASCGYGDTVTIKVCVLNEYMENVYALVTATIYDNLLVPIYPPAAAFETIPGTAVIGSGGIVTGPGFNVTCFTLPGVAIPSYAFVGTAYVVANILSTWPNAMGTAFCPPAWTTFQIAPPA